ncbi:hypothetical protein OPKNFCMD_6202 [Methylobacterium crusticola]|uniref:DUF4376 domain-containing protein n=1 Tax=Methylobacterium crusticola TaxID=1697972 RepID=A0ABQ4R6T4_9HYPH|nr:DUF4376 domain-containing protein [Methylobacterium crusticola]GJD53427.1 hypothetical protein OPKNFCMD_6202 [Methylobacterium crusticola]
MFAIMDGNRVSALAPREPDLPRSIEVLDVSGIPGIMVGWTRGPDGRLHAPVLPKESLRDCAREVCRTIEQGGVAVPAVGGLRIATDDRSKTLVLGARMAALADPGFTTTWFALDGSRHALRAPEVVAISDAVLAHVAACFAARAAVEAAIEAGTVTTSAEVAAAPWPPAAPPGA